MRISYKITFYSFWHCGSGLAAGADVDALAIKDSNGLPFIPGKTIKGLIKQAMLEISGYRGEEACFEDLFGAEGQIQSPLFFSNAKLEDEAAIVDKQLQKYLYESISSTRLDENGIAKEHSLRKMEVVIPCSLTGQICGIPSEKAKAKLIEAMSYIKNMGLRRHRGLGRCRFTISED